MKGFVPGLIIGLIAYAIVCGAALCWPAVWPATIKQDLQRASDAGIEFDKRRCFIIAGTNSSDILSECIDTLVRRTNAGIAQHTRLLSRSRDMKSTALLDGLLLCYTKSYANFGVSGWMECLAILDRQFPDPAIKRRL